MFTLPDRSTRVHSRFSVQIVLLSYVYLTNQDNETLQRKIQCYNNIYISGEEPAAF